MDDIKALIHKTFPNKLAVDLFVQVTPNHEEDFARVEVDLPEGKEFFLITRGHFETAEAAYRDLLEKLKDELNPIPKEDRYRVAQLLEHPRDCFIDSDHPAMKDPGHWCVGPVVFTRDSNLVENTNYIRLVEALDDCDDIKGDWEIHESSDWAVGWVKHLSFRVLDEKGAPTEAYRFVKKWSESLEDYPCADEELLSQMEYDAAIEAIEQQGARWLKDPSNEEWAASVWKWIWDNAPRELDHDGNGAYPSEEIVREAMKKLGIHEPEEEDA